MTSAEFQMKYHDYATSDSMQALSDSIKINEKLTDGKCVPVKIGNQYCLMLDTAAAFLKENDII